MSSDIFRETRDVDENQLAHLIRRTLWPGTRTFTRNPWPGVAMLVQDKVYRISSSICRNCLIFTLSDENFLHILILYSSIANLRVYVGHAPILKNAKLYFFSWERQIAVVYLVALAKKIVWWTRLKELKTDIFPSSTYSISFEKKIEYPGESPSLKQFCCKVSECGKYGTIKWAYFKPGKLRENDAERACILVVLMTMTLWDFHEHPKIVFLICGSIIRIYIIPVLFAFLHAPHCIIQLCFFISFWTLSTRFYESALQPVVRGLSWSLITFIYLVAFAKKVVWWTSS